jgi:hypothetical protein
MYSESLIGMIEVVGGWMHLQVLNSRGESKVTMLTLGVSTFQLATNKKHCCCPDYVAAAGMPETRLVLEVSMCCCLLDVTLQACDR